MMNQEQQPTFNNTLEQNVLVQIMASTEAWDLVAPILLAGDFYFSRHAVIFKHIKSMYESQSPVDEITVADRIKRHGDIDSVGGEAYLIELMSCSSWSTVNTLAYAERIKEMSIQRRLLSAADQIKDIALSAGVTADSALEQAEKLILGVADERQSVGGVKSVGSIDMLRSTIDFLDLCGRSETGLTGLDTGLDRLNKMTNGWQAGDMVVIGARPSMGKTSLVLNFIEAIASCQKYPSVFFSIEQPLNQIGARFLSSVSRVPLNNMIRIGGMDDHQRTIQANAIARIRDMKLEICDKGGMTPSMMMAVLRRVYREYGGIGCIATDYFQKLKIEGYGKGQRNNELNEISQMLKEMAKEYKCPHFVLSQLGKECERRPNKRPMASDLRDCGGIEADADQIIMVYRDEKYHPDSKLKGIAELIIDKNRNGEIGVVPTAFRGDIFRFDNLAPDFEVY